MVLWRFPRFSPVLFCYFFFYLHLFNGVHVQHAHDLEIFLFFFCVLILYRFSSSISSVIFSPLFIGSREYFLSQFPLPHPGYIYIYMYIYIFCIWLQFFFLSFPNTLMQSMYIKSRSKFLQKILMNLKLRYIVVIILFIFFFFYTAQCFHTNSTLYVYPGIWVTVSFFTSPEILLLFNLPVIRILGNSLKSSNYISLMFHFILCFLGRYF